MARPIVAVTAKGPDMLPHAVALVGDLDRDPPGPSGPLGLALGRIVPDSISELFIGFERKKK